MKIITHLLTLLSNRITIALASVILTIILLGNGCSKDKEISRLQEEIQLKELRNQSLVDSLKNKDGQIVKMQQAAVFHEKETLSRYADSVFALKKRDDRKYGNTIAFYQDRIQTLLDSLYIAYEPLPKDTIYIPQLPDSLKPFYTRVPQQVKLDSAYFKLDQIIKKDGIVINHLEFTDTLTGRWVEKKGGLFRPNTIEYQVTNTNKYNRISGANSAIYIPKEEKHKFLKRYVIPAVAGFLVKTFIK